MILNNQVINDGSAELNIDVQSYCLNPLFLVVDKSWFRYVFGVCAIIIGLIFCIVNYQGTNLKARNFVVWLICSIFGICVYVFMYFAIVATTYDMNDTLLRFLAGFILGQICFFLSKSMQLFVIFIGAVTGFCFANTFEIIIFYKY